MTNNGDMPEIPVETLAETENYAIWSALEPDGETTYHVELGVVTLHLFTEEWGEFVGMIREMATEVGAEVGSTDEGFEIELDWGALFFVRDEWNELVQLIGQVRV